MFDQTEPNHMYRETIFNSNPFTRYLKDTYKQFLTIFIHGWFCTTCLSFVVISSLPRISVVLDIIITFCLYVKTVEEQKGNLTSSTASLVLNDLESYSFSKSITDFLIITLFRAAVYFKNFAYRKNVRFKKVILNPLISASLTTLFIIAKLFVIRNKNTRSLLIFSLCATWVSLLLFAIFKGKTTKNTRFEKIPSSVNEFEFKSKEDFGYNAPFLSVNQEGGLKSRSKIETIATSNFKFVVEIFCQPRKDHFNKSANEKFIFIICGLLDPREGWKETAANLSSTGGVKVVLVDLLRRARRIRESRESNENELRSAFFELLEIILGTDGAEFSHERQISLIAHSSSCASVVSFAKAFFSSWKIKLDSLILISPAKFPPPVLSCIIEAKIDKEIMAQLLKTEFNDILPGLLGIKKSDELEGVFSQFFRELRSMPSDDFVELFRSIKNFSEWEKGSSNLEGLPLALISPKQLIPELGEERPFLSKLRKQAILGKVKMEGGTARVLTPEDVELHLKRFLLKTE